MEENVAKEAEDPVDCFHAAFALSTQIRLANFINRRLFFKLSRTLLQSAMESAKPT